MSQGMKRDAARDATFAAMAEGGMTLADIGHLMGLSRERIRQIVRRAGVYATSHQCYSLTAIMAAVRQHDVTSIAQVASRAGCTSKATRKVLTGLALLPAVQRLFRLRCQAHHRARLIGQVHAFVAAHAMPPTSSNCTRVTTYRQRPFKANYRTIQKLFGSWHNLMLAAGYPPRRRRNGDWQHGTVTMYRHGCHCDACRAANTESFRHYRQRRAVTRHTTETGD